MRGQLAESPPFHRYDFELPNQRVSTPHRVSITMTQPQFRWLSEDAGMLNINTRGWPNTSTTESPTQPVVVSQEYGSKAKAVGYSCTFTSPEAWDAT